MPQPRILAVISDSSFGRKVPELLSRAGFAVVGPALDGEDAAELALRERPDLVLLAGTETREQLDRSLAQRLARSEADAPFPIIDLRASELAATASSLEPDAIVTESVAASALVSAVQCALDCHGANRACQEARCAQASSEACLMTVMDGAHDGIVCLDESFCITVFSRGAERIFGYGPEEVLGKTFDCLVPDSTNWLHGLKTAPERASRTTIRREAIARKKGGATFPAKLAGSLQEIEKAATVTMCMRDLSEHKLREEQLFEAQKAAMLGRMAASIAHDFKNLLAVVQGNAFLLGIEAPPNLAARISEINDAVARGVAITRQLLAYSRPRRALRKTVEINELVTKAEPLLRRLLREDIRLWVDLGADLGPAEGDPHLIEQVLMNLLANARDALPEGGEVSIRTSSYRVDSSAASAGEALAPGEYVSITVQDSGPGVPPDLKERIFEPFFTTKPSGVGTGLGLPSARSIARHGGGDVRLQATPGGGATFLVLLPRARDSVAPEPPASAGRDQAAHGTETILVVEDDPKVLLATSQILGLGGYRVLNATSAAAALEIFETTGAVGLLLADIVMPGGSGRALARRLHAQAPDLPVLFMTAGADESAPEHESTLDGWPVLHKPLPPERLLRAVRDSLDSNRA